MPRYITVEDAIKIADKECGQFRGIFARIKEQLEAIRPADVVEKDRYARLLADAIIVSKALTEYQTAERKKGINRRKSRNKRKDTKQ